MQTPKFQIFAPSTATGRIIQKSYQRIFYEIFWKGVVCSLEEANRLDNSTKFKAFEALDVSEKILFISKVYFVLIESNHQSFNFHLPRPLCSRLRADVRDRRQKSDRQTSDKQWLKWGDQGGSAPCSDLSPLQQYDPLGWIYKVLFYAQITRN